MDRRVFSALVAVGLLLNSAPSIAEHQERRINPDDRTLDYLNNRSGSLLDVDANAYTWEANRNMMFGASQTHNLRTGPIEQRNHYIHGYAPMFTIISMVPVITTTTTITEEIYYKTVRRPVRKTAGGKWKPKPRCICR